MEAGLRHCPSEETSVMDNCSEPPRPTEPEQAGFWNNRRVEEISQLIHEESVARKQGFKRRETRRWNSEFRPRGRGIHKDGKEEKHEKQTEQAKLESRGAPTNSGRVVQTRR